MLLPLGQSAPCMKSNVVDHVQPYRENAAAPRCYAERLPRSLSALDWATGYCHHLTTKGARIYWVYRGGTGQIAARRHRTQ